MTLQDKLETLRAVEAEHRFGAVLTPGADLTPIPELPAGTIEVFRLFGRLQGRNFLFKAPRSIRSPEAWAARLTDGFPHGEHLQIGAEIWTQPEHLPGMTEEDEDGSGYGGAQILMSVEDGRVRYIDPDDYIELFSDHDDVDGLIRELAPDLVTFFDRFVLGERYPELVDLVLGEGTADDLHRKTGEYADPWRRLLIAADLAG
ncbi:hypothetical protein [Actinoplanes couchii]|uniref:Knr4/Smi1-like domain-containing protein n=1 Tax=Actinoplanes couchii TaxID=403638 RepID=A0ABQ3XKN4_9ACTN|nr:hypothetical protein [Actinoplanes couchii]MDR6319551.1 hypothetical protein [Actinoplanes couchii]GID59059.1 hypothetical protein Aco03nite_074630 [Actinoplanes couchii]